MRSVTQYDYRTCVVGVKIWDKMSDNQTDTQRCLLMKNGNVLFVLRTLHCILYTTRRNIPFQVRKIYLMVCIHLSNFSTYAKCAVYSAPRILLNFTYILYQNTHLEKCTLYIDAKKHLTYLRGLCKQSYLYLWIQLELIL